MDKIGKTGIVPFTYFGGAHTTAGSTSLRVDSLAATTSDFKKWEHGSRYDNLIFQKVYWKEMMELFDGPKILDICDPDWLIYGIDIIEIGNLVHAITCSSDSLTQLMKNYFPDKIVECVPDRINPMLFPPPHAMHKGSAREVIWFGFIHNAHETLEQLAGTIMRYNLSLTIVSDKPYSKADKIKKLNPEFVKYYNSLLENKNRTKEIGLSPQKTDNKTFTEAYSVIRRADIVLNPKSERAFYKYKSNNKNIISWQLGVPVAETVEDIVRLIDPGERNREVMEKQQILNKEYNIRTHDPYIEW